MTNFGNERILKNKQAKKHMNEHIRIYRRNVAALVVIRAVLKRAYLPLIVVYAVSVGVTIPEIGLIAAITAAVSLFLEIPSGYLADRIGHKSTIIIGTILSAIAPLLYVVTPDFWGVLGGSVTYFAGIAFLSGTDQALLHETLLAVGRDGMYASVAARIQRWSLSGNVITLLLVPPTWAIDPRMPFLIAFILQLLAVIAACILVSPSGKVPVTAPFGSDLRSLWYTIISRGDAAFFVFLGFTGAISCKFFEYRELYYQDIGMDVTRFGAYAALSSVVGIFATYAVPHAKGIAQRTYLTSDYIAYGLAGILIGMTTNAVAAVGIATLMTGYYRVRKILITENLLIACPDRSLKATYLSTASFVEALWGIAVPLALGAAMGALGLAYGYIMSGIGVIVIASTLFVFALNTSFFRSATQLSTKKRTS